MVTPLVIPILIALLLLGVPGSAAIAPAENDDGDARPRLARSSYWGGSGDDYAVVRRAPDGALYLTGTTTSRDLFLKRALTEKRGKRADAWITKLSRNGRRVRYSTYLGGRGLDGVADAVVDDAGNLIVVGSTNSPDFPLKNPVDGELTGSKDGFVTKLSPSGKVLFSTFLGGSGGDHLTAVDAGAAGAVYVHGYTFSSDFPTTPGALKPATEVESQDATVAKLSPDGELVYSTRLGGEESSELGYDIVVDAAGSAYVSGWADADDFPTVNAVQPEHAGSYDAYVAKIDPTGSALGFSTFLGGSREEGGGLLSERPGGGVAVALVTESRGLASGGFQDAYGGGRSDVYVALLSSDGSEIDAASYLGGSGNEEVRAVVAEPTGDLYVVGSTGSTDFPLKEPFQRRFGGKSKHNPYLAEGFVSSLSADLSALSFSSYLGGSRDDGVTSLATTTGGAAWLAGTTYSRDFPTRRGRDRSWNGGSDAWFAKITR